MADDIIVIVMDSVRFDRIFGEDALSTPNIDALAENSVQFNQTYSTGSWTVPAHGSLFTGELPSSHGSHARNEKFDILPEKTLSGKISKSGYKTVGFSANPWISEEFNFNSGYNEFIEFSHSLPFPNAGHLHDINTDLSGIAYVKEIIDWLQDGPTVQRFINGVYHKFTDSHPTSPAEDINKKIKEWFSNYSSEEPIFSFVNYMDAHEPYRTHLRYLSSDTADRFQNIETNWNHRSLVDPPAEKNKRVIRAVYDASIQYLDEQIGELIDFLGQQERYEDACIVLLGDHGQMLGERDYWGHGTFLYHKLLHVPLLIKMPQSRDSGVIEEPVSLCHIPEFLLANFSGDGKNNSRIKTLIENQKTTDEPVIAESHGPYETENLPEGVASSAGYRVIYYGPWRLHRNLENEEITFEQPVAESSEESPPKEELLRIEDEYCTDIQTQEDHQPSISESTKQRLTELGYR